MLCACNFFIRDGAFDVANGVIHAGAMLNKQCPSCGGDCGRTNLTGCQYQGRARNILATGEMEDIRAILKKWGYNTVEACIESYLLGITRRRKAAQDTEYR